MNNEFLCTSIKAVQHQQQCRQYSPLNLNVLRKNALNLVSQAQYGRISKKRMMFKAALDPELFLKILFAPLK